MESFEEFTVVGNLTTEIISISISLIEELNELMISEGLSVNQSELQVTRLEKGRTNFIKTLNKTWFVKTWPASTSILVEKLL